MNEGCAERRPSKPEFGKGEEEVVASQWRGAANNKHWPNPGPKAASVGWRIVRGLLRVAMSKVPVESV